MNNYEKVVFISDIHAPFEDKNALRALYGFIRWFKPKTVFIMGDLLDAYAISRFTKDPKGKLNFKKEIDTAKSILKEIRKVSGKAKIYYLKGNHEARMQKYLWNRAEELSGLEELEVPTLLKLKDLNIEYIPTGKILYKGSLIKHGTIVRKFAGYSAKAEFEHNGSSGVSAHTHRLSVYAHSNNSGTYQWMETGCLCDLNQEYLEDETPNWQQGFGVGYFSNSATHFETININKGTAIYAGKTF